jgi:hypothetical protein
VAALAKWLGGTTWALKALKAGLWKDRATPTPNSSA